MLWSSRWKRWVGEGLSGPGGSGDDPGLVGQVAARHLEINPAEEETAEARP